MDNDEHSSYLLSQRVCNRVLSLVRLYILWIRIRITVDRHVVRPLFIQHPADRMGVEGSLLDI